MTSAVAMISPKFYGFDPETGNLLAFGKVYTYSAGTNTPKASFSSEDAAVANPNPVVLNGAGYADIYLAGSYKIVVTDADDVEVWTADPVSDATQLLREWIHERTATQVAPDQFKLIGNLTDLYVPGRAVQLDDTTLLYGWVKDVSYLSGETFVTVDVAGTLTSELTRAWTSVLTALALPNAGFRLGGTVAKTLDSLADLKALGPDAIMAGNVVRTLGYYTPGDGGGNDYEIVAGATGTADGGSFIDLSGSGFQAKGLFSGSGIDVAKFGAREDVDAYPALLAAAKTSNGAVIVNQDVFCSQDNQLAFADIVFTGHGSIEGLPRKSVFRNNENMVDTKCSHIPIAQKKRLQDKVSPVVVLAGDSTATYNANIATRGGMLTNSIETSLRDYYGDITFHNRAVGGTTYVNFDSKPTASQIANTIWYDNDQVDWLDYIEALSPDILFIHFGMNDSENFKSSALKSVVAKINVWTKVPEIIFSTTPNPSLSGPASNPSLANVQEQDGREIVSGYVQSYANYNDYACLDFNRKSSIARDGIDRAVSQIGNRQTLFPVSGDFQQFVESETHSYNFKFELTVDFDLTLDPGNYIDVKLGGKDLNKIRIKNQNGFFRFGLYEGTDTQSFYVVVDTDIPIPSGEYSICVEKTNNYVIVYERSSNLGSNTEPWFYHKIITDGGRFLPIVSTDITSPNKIKSATVETDKRFVSRPTCTDSELWGDEASAVDTWGGSGWNHPSSLMARLVYYPVIKSIFG